MSRISGAISGADPLIYAMKQAMRLAQRLYQQAIDKMGFFNGFSRRRIADSGLPQKRDSGACFWPVEKLSRLGG
jgi:hypothetical protein